MAFTRALGKAAPADGMRVVGINPGPVATERMTMLMRARAERDLGDAGALGRVDAPHAVRPRRHARGDR